MSEYVISQIRPSDQRACRQMEKLLLKEGIERDKNLDYSIGLFDEDYNLAATGSCFGNTLRCLAVSSDRQGEGLLNQVVTHLIEHQYRKGNTHLFLYTKCDTARFFGDLGFYEIARVRDRLVFMENKKNGFSQYLEQLKKETPVPQHKPSTIGTVIMNANPFTLGHQYLLTKAASMVDMLHVFVVSEEQSLVPFTVRDRLVKEGSAHLSNLVYHQTGPYLISNATFPSYFLKDSDTVIRSHAQLDVQIFSQIAEALGVTDRFVGEEPFSQVTGIYNQVMQEALEQTGIRFTVFARKADGDGAISASLVRQLIQEGNIQSMKEKVPECTYRFFTSPEAEPVIKEIRHAGNVIHY